MGKDYILFKDAWFLQWAENYSDLITANPTSYTLTARIETVLAGISRELLANAKN